MQTRAEEAITLATEHGFPFFSLQSTVLKGWTLAKHRQTEIGIAQMRQSMNALRDLGIESTRPYHLALLAEVYWEVGQAAEGLTLLAEALKLANNSGERFYVAELYRLHGELTLAQSSVQDLAPSVQKEAEECFWKAIEIARKQQAKSLELRAVMSLARLRQRQAAYSESRITQHESRIRLDEAHKMLSEVYHWFTEGFDTKDLQEAKALLEELH